MKINIRSAQNSLPYVFIAGVAFYMFRGIFAPGFMSGYDNSFHYFDAYYLTRTLIPEYHWISGWSMQCLAGFPVLVDYYQIGFWLIAILNKAWLLPLGLSYKLTVLFSYICLGAGFYKISSYRFGKIAALLVAVCLMLQKDIYCDRILGGIWNNYLAIGIFLLFFHLLDKYADSLSLKKSLILGLLLGILILTHLYVALFAFMPLFVYAFFCFWGAFREKKNTRGVLFYAIVPVVAFLVSACYLYGFIIAGGYFAKMSSKDLFTGLAWSAKALFGPLERGADAPSTLLINLPVLIRVVFGFLGMYMYIRKEKNKEIKRFLTCTLFYILVSLMLFSDIFVNLFGWWRNIPFLGNLQSNRFLIYAQLGMYLFAGYALGRFLERVRKKAFATTVFTILLAGSIFFHYVYFAREASRTLEQSPRMADVRRVWNWIDENISPQKGRIVYQNTIGDMDDPIFARSDVFALSGIFTDVAQIGVSRSASPFPQEIYMRNDHGSIFGKKIDAVDALFIKDMMESFNARHIVSVEPDLRRRLCESALFYKEKDFGSFSVFSLQGADGGGWLEFRKNADYKVSALENQRLVFAIFNRSDDNTVFIKFAYHPLWRAWLDKRPVIVEQGKYSLMKISLPEKGNHELILKFNSFNPVWVGVSIVSFVICLVLIGWKSVKA